MNQLSPNKHSQLSSTLPTQLVRFMLAGQRPSIPVLSTALALSSSSPYRSSILQSQPGSSIEPPTSTCRALEFSPPSPELQPPWSQAKKAEETQLVFNSLRENLRPPHSQSSNQGPAQESSYSATAVQLRLMMGELGASITRLEPIFTGLNGKLDMLLESRHDLKKQLEEYESQKKSHLENLCKSLEGLSGENLTSLLLLSGQISGIHSVF